MYHVILQEGVGRRLEVRFTNTHLNVEVVSLLLAIDRTGVVAFEIKRVASTNIFLVVHQTVEETVLDNAYTN
jgi:hypothetical protein